MSEGHIRPRGKCSWEIKYDIGRNPLTGERQIKYQTVHGTKRDAQRELRRQLTAVDTGQFTDSRKLTLGEYLVWWLDNEAQNKAAPKTLQVYRYMADKHIVPALPCVPKGQQYEPGGKPTCEAIFDAAARGLGQLLSIWGAIPKADVNKSGIRSAAQGAMPSAS